MNFDQDLIFIRSGFFYLLELENIRRSIFFIYNRFHLSILLSYSSRFKSKFFPPLCIYALYKKPQDLRYAANKGDDQDVGQELISKRRIQVGQPTQSSQH